MIISVKKYIREFCRKMNSIGVEYMSEYTMTNQIKLIGYKNLKPLMADFYNIHENDLMIRWDI